MIAVQDIKSLEYMYETIKITEESNEQKEIILKKIICLHQKYIRVIESN